MQRSLGRRQITDKKWRRRPAITAVSTGLYAGLVPFCGGLIDRSLYPQAAASTGAQSVALKMAQHQLV